jgi:hypothetical protein
MLACTASRRGCGRSTRPALDPFRGYANAIHEGLPDAVAVLDAFHVVRLETHVVMTSGVACSMTPPRLASPRDLFHPNRSVFWRGAKNARAANGGLRG